MVNVKFGNFRLKTINTMKRNTLLKFSYKNKIDNRQK